MLHELHLDNLPLSSSFLKALAERAEFKELRELSFNGNAATNEAVKAVLQSHRLPKLNRLSLVNCTGLSSRPALARAFGHRVRL